MRTTCVALLITFGACASGPSLEPAEPAALSAQSDPAAAPARGVAATEASQLLPNAHVPLPSIVTGGAPSEPQLRAAQGAGYKTVVSLLPETEPEAEQVHALGMTFVSIPVAGPQDLTEDNARKLGEAMSTPDAKPLLLHCASGNRAGALLAMKAFYVDHASAEDALKLGESAGLSGLRPTVEAKLKGSTHGQVE